MKGALDCWQRAKTKKFDLENSCSLFNRWVTQFLSRICMCGNKLLNRMGNLRRVFLGCSDARLLLFRNPNLLCLLSQQTLVLIGVLGRQYWVCFTEFARGIVSSFPFGGFSAVGGMGGFAFGSHICFVP